MKLSLGALQRQKVRAGRLEHSGRNKKQDRENKRERKIQS